MLKRIVPLIGLLAVMAFTLPTNCKDIDYFSEARWQNYCNAWASTSAVCGDFSWDHWQEQWQLWEKFWISEATLQEACWTGGHPVMVCGDWNGEYATWNMATGYVTWTRSHPYVTSMNKDGKNDWCPPSPSP